MELPRVGPVGIVLAFLLAGTASSVLSLGSYCLTTYAGTPAHAPAR